MDILIAVAVLLPLVIVFMLTLAVTVHFFWLAHRHSWPPNMQSAPAAEQAAAMGTDRRRKGPPHHA